MAPGPAVQKLLIPPPHRSSAVCGEEEPATATVAPGLPLASTFYYLRICREFASWVIFQVFVARLYNGLVEMTALVIGALIEGLRSIARVNVET
jgi:hypothetical protein